MFAVAIAAIVVIVFEQLVIITAVAANSIGFENQPFKARNHEIESTDSTKEPITISSMAFSSIPSTT